MRTSLLAACLLALPAAASAQQPAPKAFTHADTLRGGLDTPGRGWWDLAFYDLHVAISPADSSIRGWNAISWRAVARGRELQVDLMTPLEVDSVTQRGHTIPFRRDGNAFFVAPTAGREVGEQGTITVYYHGKPRPAVRPPWDGG